MDGLIRVSSAAAASETQMHEHACFYLACLGWLLRRTEISQPEIIVTDRTGPFFVSQPTAIQPVNQSTLNFRFSRSSFLT